MKQGAVLGRSDILVEAGRGDIVESKTIDKIEEF